VDRVLVRRAQLCGCEKRPRNGEQTGREKDGSQRRVNSRASVHLLRASNITASFDTEMAGAQPLSHQ
jgi:hypothetical protein